MGSWFFSSAPRHPGMRDSGPVAIQVFIRAWGRRARGLAWGPIPRCGLHRRAGRRGSAGWFDIPTVVGTSIRRCGWVRSSGPTWVREYVRARSWLRSQARFVGGAGRLKIPGIFSGLAPGGGWGRPGGPISRRGRPGRPATSKGRANGDGSLDWRTRPQAARGGTSARAGRMGESRPGGKPAGRRSGTAGGRRPPDEPRPHRSQRGGRAGGAGTSTRRRRS